MNYSNNYRENKYYKQKYNNLIENFSDNHNTEFNEKQLESQTIIYQDLQNTAHITDNTIDTEDYNQRYIDFNANQDSLSKIDQEYDSILDKNFTTYNNDTINSNTLNQLHNRNQYINNYQEDIKKQRSGISNKLNSDIQTKERYVQIGRYEYLKKRKIIKYCQFFSIVFTLSLVCYLVGTKYEDENIRILLNILTVIIYIIALIFLFFMIKNDSRRYILDWDEIYYSSDPINWKDTSKSQLLK